MADVRELRSKRRQEITNNKATPTPTAPTAPKAKAQVKAAASRTSLTTINSRLSISNRTAPKPVVNLEELIKSLESRLNVVETCSNQLIVENTELKQAVERLQTEVNELKGLHDSNRLSTSPAVSLNSGDQQEINPNIIIRGIETKNDTSAADLTNIYEGIRAHLGISDIPDLAPVSVTLLSSNAAKPNSTLRPIKVVLPSVAAKTKFLQVRRTKKDIVQADIGITSNSKRPVLITEQLTRANQVLLYQARSLREQGNFKFIWSKNGEIFGRHKPNSRVIRIIDKTHINHLREQLGLQPLSNYGRLHTGTDDQSAEDNPRI